MHFSIFRHDACPSIKLPKIQKTIPRRSIIKRSPPTTKRQRKLVTSPDTSSAMVEGSSADVTDRPDTSTATERRDPSPPTKSIGIQTDSQPPARNLHRRLRTQNRQLKFNFLNERASNKRLLRKLNKLERQQAKSCSKCNEIKKLPDAITSFIDEQVASYQRKKVRWSQTTVAISQSLLYKSPACYRKLHQYFSLPSLTTLYRRLPDASKSVSYISFIINQSDFDNNIGLLLCQHVHIFHFKYFL